MTDKFSIQQQWDIASFNDNFVFSKTLELFPDICKQIIEFILEVKVNHISYPEREKVIEARTDSKGIRLDVYVQDDSNDEDTSLTLNDGAVKIFLSTKGSVNDVSPELKNFLNYVDSGIVSGNFIQRLDDAVHSVKSNEKARLEFMTFQMYFKERELESEQKGREEERNFIALNLIGLGLDFDKIQSATHLSLEKIKELAKLNLKNQ